LTAATAGFAQTNLPVVRIQADKVRAQMPPTFYGLMTEEINYSYEGGLYGELIRNRTFKANPTNAIFWSAVGSAAISLNPNMPLNDSLNTSLKLDATAATNNSPAGIANSGYWGIPIRPRTAYTVSFYAKAATGFSGSLTVSLESADGKKIFASTEISGLTGDWKKFEATLTTKKLKASKENVFKLTTASPGTVWLQQVSLFPPTFNNRANGNRVDLSQLLAAAQPKFLRFPGGNYVEGDNFNERFNWKKMIGPVDQRAGHRSCWGYWSTDGFGLPEFLGWCDDLGMEPVLAVFAGFTLKQDHVVAGPDLEPYVQEALEEIEYVTGDATTTKWGAQRALDGHPAPFKLRYVEIGNEDNFDKSHSYDGRFAQFYDAIKAKYPQLQIIATTTVKSRTPDLVDEHFYRTEEEMESQAFLYDTRDRNSPTKIFVGEWATRVGSPTPNLAGALGDAAWMCNLERNADIVLMHCYVPLFVNVSDLGAGRSMQWRSDLIGYDALSSYGSPSYYAQKIFSQYQGDEVLATTAENLPTYIWHQSAKKRNGVEQPAATREVKSLFYSAMRDTKNGKLIVKIVNRADTAQPVKIEISGANIASRGSATVLKAKNRDATNSLAEPKKVVPVTEKVHGLGTSFTRTYPPCSITILELDVK
jgi:alpha-N-arabinofuranosidase